MRYALIMAGGSGTRLWPMSRAATPKQLIPFIHGRSLIQVAWDRLDGLIPPERRYICAGSTHRDAILAALPDLDHSRYLAEPMGRDTLNAVGLGAAVIGASDPDATIAVFTADHLIEPINVFQSVVQRGYELAEEPQPTLVTFGITPTLAATGYGYLELGAAIEGGELTANVVDRFKEKPNADIATQYLSDGPTRYLWNSGMFVWRADVLMNAIGQYEAASAKALQNIAAAWNTPQRDTMLNDIYPTLKKISVDFALMEPASTDPAVRVTAVQMPVTWLDVGSWPAFADTCQKDSQSNAIAADKHVLIDSKNCLVASNDSNHLVTAIGCDDLIVIHTPDATLVCKADQAERIKQLHGLVGEQFSDRI